MKVAPRLDLEVTEHEVAEVGVREPMLARAFGVDQAGAARIGEAEVELATVDIEDAREDLVFERGAEDRRGFEDATRRGESSARRRATSASVHGESATPAAHAASSRQPPAFLRSAPASSSAPTTSSTPSGVDSASVVTRLVRPRGTVTSPRCEAMRTPIRLVVERREVDSSGAELGQPFEQTAIVFGARRREEEERRLGRAMADAREDVRARGVEPVGVVDADRERAEAPRQANDELGRALGEGADLEHDRRDRREHLGELRPERGGDRAEVVAGRRPNRGRERGAAVGEIAAHRGETAREHPPDRGERRVPFTAGGIEYGAASFADVGEQRLDEPRLPAPVLAGEDDGGAAPELGLVVDSAEPVELGAADDARRRRSRIAVRAARRRALARLVEIGEDGTRVRVTVVGIEGNEATDDPRERRPDLERVELGEDLAVVGGTRESASERLEEDATERVEIGAGVDARRNAELLRRGIGRRCPAVVRGEPHHHRRRESEIDQAHRPLDVEHHGARLDVTMDEPRVVDGGEHVGEVEAEVDDLLLGQRAEEARRSASVSATDELGHEVG